MKTMSMRSRDLVWLLGLPVYLLWTTVRHELIHTVVLAEILFFLVGISIARQEFNYMAQTNNLTIF